MSLYNNSASGIKNCHTQFGVARVLIIDSVIDLVFCDFSQSEAEVADFDRAYRPHPPLARS